MLDKLKSVFSFINDWKVIIPIVAAIVMYFTPDSVDRIIQTTLKLFGMKEYVIHEAHDKDGTL